MYAVQFSGTHTGSGAESFEPITTNASPIKYGSRYAVFVLAHFGVVVCVGHVYLCY